MASSNQSRQLSARVTQPNDGTEAGIVNPAPMPHNKSHEDSIVTPDLQAPNGQGMDFDDAMWS